MDFNVRFAEVFELTYSSHENSECDVCWKWTDAVEEGEEK